MPKIELPSGPQVREAALPNARVRIKADEEAFGGGRSAELANQATQAVFSDTQKLLYEEKQKADDVATTEAYTRLVKAKNRLTYDPQAGALTRTGKNAFGVIDEYGTSFDKEADEIEKGLSNPTQKAMFQKIRSQQRMDFDGTLNKHVFTESKKFDEETTTSSIATTRDDALRNYMDPERVNQAIGMQRVLVMEHAKRQGLPPEMAKLQLDDVTSKTHAGVLTRMLSNGQDLKAKEYFEMNRTGLTGAEAAHMEKALEEGTLRGESMRQSDALISSSADMSEALAGARKIEDPKVRDAATDRIKSYYASKRAAENERDENIMREAGNIIDKTGDYHKIPATQLALLSPQSKSSLQSYAEKKREGSLATDWQKYYDLKTLASSQVGSNSFLKMNLMSVREHMADAQFKELVDIQTSLRKNDGKAEKELDGYRTTAQIVDGLMRGAGIDPTPKDTNASQAKVANEFRRRVELEMKKHAERTGKEPNRVEVQSIAEGLLVETITEKGILWDTKKRLFEADENAAIDVNPKDIPKADRQRIEEALRMEKKPVTEASIKTMYERKLRGMNQQGIAKRGY